MAEETTAAKQTNEEAVKRMKSAMREHEELEKAKDDLAKRAITLVNDVTAARLPKAAQLQALRNLSNQTETPAELRIYVQYQVARSSKNPRSEQFFPAEFGTPLITQIDEICATPGPLLMKKLRHFMGYLYRYGKYVRPD